MFVTRGSFIEEGDFLFQHTLKHLTLDGGVYEAHGGVVDEITHKLKQGTLRKKKQWVMSQWEIKIAHIIIIRDS